jgi:hypothetical protein
MAEANVGWGAPRIHGELLKLGIDIGERNVSRFMPPRLSAARFLLTLKNGRRLGGTSTG